MAKIAKKDGKLRKFARFPKVYDDTKKPYDQVLYQIRWRVCTGGGAEIEAQRLNEGNGEALKNMMLLALAAKRGVSFAEVSALDIGVTWRNPSMPSVATQSDAMVKQIGSIPWLADSDIALQELGYS